MLFFPVCFWLFPVLSIFLAIYLQHFGAEGAISTVFAAFSSSNLIFHGICTILARTVHGTWSIATRVHLGLVLGLIQDFC